MISTLTKRRGKEGGYSLVEALVVVGIIGVVSLVTIPNFISLYRAFRFKASLRQFTSDVRYARQQAVSKNCQSMLSFVPDTRDYRIYESTDKGATWTDSGFRGELGEMGYFHDSSTFDDDEDPEDSLDIIFLNNGTAVETGEVVMRTNDEIPVNEYTVAVAATGKLTTTEGNF